MVDRANLERPARIRKGYEERRAEVVRSAIGLIAARGYNAVTVQMLADGCGMTKAGWLHYFASKDEMLFGLLAEVERRDSTLLAPIVERGLAGDADTARAAAVALLDTVIEQFLDCPDMARFAIVLQCEAIDAQHPAHEWFRRSEVALLEALAALLGRSCPNAQVVARHLHALMSGLGQQWLRASESFDLLAVWLDASEAILPGLRASNAGAKT